MHCTVAAAVAITLLPLACALSVLPSRSDRASRFLQSEGRRLDSTELLQLGNQVKGPDDLDKVKNMIRHMISHHMAAQAEDTDHKSFCDKELVASKKKLEQKKMEIEKRTADQDMSSAKLAQLKDSIGDLHTGIAQAHKDRQKAAQLREKEAEAYKQSKAEWDQTLQELKRKLRSDIHDEREAAQKAEEEITLKQVRAENKEEEAQFNFKKMTQDLDVALARKTKEVEQKERQVVKMNHDISLGDGDFKMAKDEMAAAKEYQEKVKNSCLVSEDPAVQRKAQRKEQISSLKEAYGILSGEEIPVLG